MSIKNTATNETTASGATSYRRPVLTIDIFDYHVLDRNGDKVGTVNNLWPAHDGSGLAFIGVKTGWIFGRDHVVPADGAEIDRENRTVRMPLDKDTIKAAPDFEVTDEILNDNSVRIRQYYGYQPDYAIEAQPLVETREDRETERRNVTPGISRDLATGQTEQVEVPIREERVTVGKREVESGSVRLRRVIRDETVNIPVELRREEVVIERVPADQVTGATDRQITEDEIVIPVTREEPVVQKTTEVTGAVRARKTQERATSEVTETVRKEDVEVDRNIDRSKRE